MIKFWEDEYHLSTFIETGNSTIFLHVKREDYGVVVSIGFSDVRISMKTLIKGFVI